MGDLPQRHQNSHIRQRGQSFLEIMPARRNLARLRLVPGREAFDRVQDHRSLELQPVAGIGAIFALGQSEFEQSRVEQLPSVVAGEGPAGTVGAMFSWSEANNRKPRVAIAECRHRRVPPTRMLVTALLAKGHQPRAQWAVARRLGLGDRRQISRLDHASVIARSGARRQAADLPSTILEAIHETGWIASLRSQ